MIDQYFLDQSELVLTSDLAGEFPLYLYLSNDRSIFLYSKSIVDLLNDIRINKPLKLSYEGLSFLLQSGVIPPPKTAYQNIYILGVGDRAKIYTKNGGIDLQFFHEFPFKTRDRSCIVDKEPDEDLILKLLAESTIKRIDESKPSFLFHSAGKDSNTIALALAEAGWQDKVTLITHKSKGNADESSISAKIARNLGFKHKILFEVDQLTTDHYFSIENYFSHSPLPCTDSVTLAYSLYLNQLPELNNSNIIDGGGNDSYMITPLKKNELNIFPLSKITSRLSFMRNFVISESLLSPLLRTPAEWCGMSGLSYYDTKKIFPNAVNVFSHWDHESKIRKDWDLFDFKTNILTSVTASEMHIRKVRNFTDSIASNLILPFSNENVAKCFLKMPEKYLFDRKKLKNKIILRKILSERVDLDSDALGKLGFTYDTRTVILKNWNFFYNEIFSCDLWEKDSLEKIIFRLRASMDKGGWVAKSSLSLIYRIYLISAWFNHNNYIK